MGEETSSIPAATHAALTAKRSLASAPGEEDDRRPGVDGGLPGAGELASVGEILAVQGDQPRRLVRRVGLDQLRRAHVGLVPEGDEAREPKPELGPDQPDLEREVAALRDEPDRARLEILRAKLELRAGVVDAEAVRPDEDGARRANPLDDGALPRRAFLAHLAEAGADDDDGLRAHCERIRDRLLYPRRRHTDHDQLGRLGQPLERRMGRPPENLAAPAVDEVDGAAALTPHRAAGEPESPLARDGGGAQDRDRAGIEERAEIPRHARRRREMTRRWMSDVPSSISSSLASRIHFSTGYSRE